VVVGGENYFNDICGERKKCRIVGLLGKFNTFFHFKKSL
jgi:hypothetical protein